MENIYFFPIGPEDRGAIIAGARGQTQAGMVVAASASSTGTATPYSDAKILIVDDEAFHLSFVERLLRTAGYTNLWMHTDPREVESLHRVHDFDLILLDIHMPHLSGIDVIDRLRRHDPNAQAPVIVMTGDDDLQIRFQALDHGARDFLVKPPRKEEMLSRIRNILEVGHLHRQNRAERNRYQQLLNDILPRYIVDRLNEGQNDIVDDFADVSVLFADLVGFTSVCARLDSRIVVETLNRIFTAMDHLADIHGIEKIKTIGDAYMAISGVGEVNPAHMARMADFALAMVDTLEKLHDSLAVPFQIRVGIERGPLIAGLLKLRRSVFDVWGDTVNGAARLQTASAPNRILVSRHFADAIDNDFILEPTSGHELRGIGRTETLFLVSRK